MSSFLVKGTEGSFRAGRKNTQIQPGVEVLALGLFMFGNEMFSVLAVNSKTFETRLVMDFRLFSAIVLWSLPNLTILPLSL